MQFWDTSALVKIYAEEIDSEVYFALLQFPVRRASFITRVELPCALYRKQQAGDLSQLAAEHYIKEFSADVAAGEVLLAPADEAVAETAVQLISQAMQLRKPLLFRSLDALQLATFRRKIGDSEEPQRFQGAFG